MHYSRITAWSRQKCSTFVCLSEVSGGAVVAVLYLQQHWRSLSFYRPLREEDRTFLSRARKVQCAAVAVMAQAHWIALLQDGIVLKFIFAGLT